MRKASPPVLFLSFVACTWVAIRGATLTLAPQASTASRPAIDVDAAPSPIARADIPSAVPRQPLCCNSPLAVRGSGPVPTARDILRGSLGPTQRIAAVTRPAFPKAPQYIGLEAQFSDPPTTVISALSPSPASSSAWSTPADRWALSTWLFIRPTAGPTALGQGLLGGSQAGVRVARRLDRDGRAEAYARIVSSGRFGDGAEGAVGLAVRPLPRVPVQIMVERRERLTGPGGRSAFAALVAGGVSERALPARFRLDAYGAAGVVGAQRRDLFVEGSAVARRAVLSVGGVQIDAGAGVWGSAQTSHNRLNVGPSIAARLPFGAVTPRLSVDWRQRVAGDAAPGSGLAVTLAADF